MATPWSELHAILLTDVVGSTELSERLGDAAMAELWAAHDRVARDLLLPWRGREIDKSDGMLLLFDCAAHAVGYAQAYHHALETLPVALQARAGLHVGQVTLRQNSAEDVVRGAKPLELDGLAKPTAARVMSLALGGQTLLTPEAHAALGDAAQHPWSQHSLGHWVMKGIAEPVELFEVGDDPARFATPPDGDKVYRVVRVDGRWLPVRQIPNNLPQQANAFIGRERELDEIKRELASVRLLTLLGMGGLGKTRLSLQVAAESMADFPDGAWFIDLSTIREPAMVLSEAARDLGVREEPGQPLMASLCAHLKDARALLIIDNCEHLVRPAAALIHAILRAAPDVRIIASSREALRVPGEQAFPVLPLPLPRPGDSLEMLARSHAVQLFVARAQAHRPAFELTAMQAPAVVELVTRLEGIPLALELAAARVRVLSVADINRRLKDRYKLLAGGDRVLRERQKTLRALVDWSYELLNDAEQRAFRRLGVFAGGFDLAAAEAVCGAAPLDSLDVLDLLSSLVEKSLVIVDQQVDGARYRTLETLRDYVREKLEVQGELAATAAAHCEHFFALAKDIRRGLLGADQAQWIARGEADLDNLRAAMALALAGGVDAVIAVKICVAMMNFWLLRGYASEGAATVRATLALPFVQTSDRDHAWVLYVGACLAQGQGDHGEAIRQLELCLALRRSLGSLVDIAAALSTLSLARSQAGDAEAAAEGEREALGIFEQLGDRQGQAVGHLHLAQFALRQGHDAQAIPDLERALRIAREMGYPEIEAEAVLVRGEVACEQGDASLAAQCFGESLRSCQQSADKRGQARAQAWLARLALRNGDFAGARAPLLLSLHSFRDFEMREQLLDGLEDLAHWLDRTGSGPLAAALCTALSRSRQGMNLRRAARAERRWQIQLETLRSGLGGTEFAQASHLGQGWSLEEAYRSVLAGVNPEPAAP